MKKKFVFVIVSITIICFGKVFAQVTETRGNLLRINFNSPTIDLSDTLWSWTNRVSPDSYYNIICERVFTLNSKIYLISAFSDYSPISNFFSKVLLSTVAKEQKMLISTSVIDILGNYLNVDKIYPVERGVWILNGRMGNNLLTDEDSLFFVDPSGGNNLIYVVGKINGKDLVATNQLENINVFECDYYLENLSFTNSLQYTDKIILDPNGIADNFVPVNINQVIDSLYIVQNEGSSDICLATFSNNVLKLLKHLKSNLGSSWMFTDKKLFHPDFSKNDEFVSEEFSISDSTFTNRKALISNFVGTYNLQKNNVFLLRNDSLLVYSFNDEKYINCYDLSGVKHLNSIVVDSPYVYIHQILSVTDVPKPSKLPVEFALKGNYPNPFNPSTTISFVLPKRELVSVKIFNSLGQVIRELVNEERNSGENKIVWDGKNNYGTTVASGVYFYHVRTDKNLALAKMVLQK